MGFQWCHNVYIFIYLYISVLCLPDFDEDKIFLYQTLFISIINEQVKYKDKKTNESNFEILCFTIADFLMKLQSKAKKLQSRAAFAITK